MLSTAPSPAASSGRIAAIDALRGLVMLLMMVDHVREFFFIHAQVSDPMDVQATQPSLFFTRLAAHLCAPVFVALTGLAAWLYGRKQGDGDPRAAARAASGFLFKRGLFLVFLELTFVSFAWTFDLTPRTYYLQVIWAIGLSMIALAALVHLPRAAIAVVGLAVVLGHNLLDPIAIAQGQPGHAIWAILHDRGFIDLPWGARARTSYPLLPWIGVAALGYAIGPWFVATWRDRRNRLLLTGLASLTLLLLLRNLNGYGEAPWVHDASPIRTAMSWLNFTKYPPSADFLLLTLGLGALLLVVLEKVPSRLLAPLAVLGSAPLFFYLIHLYALHLLQLAAVAALGPNQGEVWSLPGVWAIWLTAGVVAIPCWYACRWFGPVKRASRQPWMKYL
ncbi:DUF1624 domain-containing protein [Caulobacter hibisci]|uniref:DUF1624 domain-containing protein n=1 Tax=Caulobacter hibisci TaxID=2035993 RepID=A0ABS0SZD5_9CAUL|nr:heparan-alpha-glucosaminide N-acetyltransferase domain-containing protein [Caulobacter hibisci]MBI1683947.1 DUF1624 domain-containing protein [Caulobacter hibisci]